MMLINTRNKYYIKNEMEVTFFKKNNRSLILIKSYFVFFTKHVLIE